MNTAPAKTHSEGLKAARLLMVLSSILPLFILGDPRQQPHPALLLHLASAR